MAKKTYEDSKRDIAEDKRGAKKLGMSLKRYEQTAQDRAEDKRGQSRLNKRK